MLLNKDSTSSKLIIIRGVPGVGKSTISKKIISMLKVSKKAYIPVDDFQLFDFRSPSNNKEKLAIKNAALLVRNFLIEGFDVVVDYAFDNAINYEKFITFILKDTSENISEMNVYKFYIDAPIETIIRRNNSRENPMKVILLKKLHDRIVATKGAIYNEIIVDSTKYSAKQCAKNILDSIF